MHEAFLILHDIWSVITPLVHFPIWSLNISLCPLSLLPSLQVLAFILLITAGVALNDLGFDGFEALDVIGNNRSQDWDWDNTAGLSRGACGFIVFLFFVIVIVEGIIIALRFLNLGIMDRFTFIFHIVVSLSSLVFFSLHLSFITCCKSSLSVHSLSQDIVISGVFAFLFLCLAFPTAVYSNLFRRYESECSDVVPGCDNNLGDAGKLDEDMGAVSVSCAVVFPKRYMPLNN